LESVVLDLLADRHPERARDFALAWAEQRSASWANAAREAEARCASDGHRPAIRGQLRYHLGEKALADAARAANLGAMPLRTTPPGGVFNVARVGRFAVVSLSVRAAHLTPRKSLTRKLLAQSNIDLEPQRSLPFGSTPNARGATELAYFGCVVAVAWKKDPTVPAELAFAVPNVELNDWIAWIPLYRVHALLQERADRKATGGASGDAFTDKVFPRFRLPKPDEKSDDGKGA